MFDSSGAMLEKSLLGSSSESNLHNHNERSPKRRRKQDKDAFEHIEHKPTVSINSEAVEFNRRVLKKLQRAFDQNPEVDLSLQLPSKYSDRLQLKACKVIDEGTQLSSPTEIRRQQQHVPDIRSIIDPTCPAEVIYPLSPVIKSLLVPFESTNTTDFSQSISDLLAKSQVIHEGAIPATRAIFRCSPEAIVKIVWNTDDYTEYTTLQFLGEHLPNFLAPKPLGLLRIDRLSFIFASYVPGQTLAKTWPELSRDHKLSIMEQLETILSDLRSIDCPPGLPLGGVQGEGCKDLRRNIRRLKDPIYTVEQYDNFLFSNARFGSKLYLDFLRRFTATTDRQICFSHGDIRQDNIIVRKDQDGTYSISGLVDWEFSGFYPCHYESTKTTNCLSTNETNDWYEYLPACLSPYERAQRWLLDYVLGWLLE